MIHRVFHYKSNACSLEKGTVWVERRWNELLNHQERTRVKILNITFYEYTCISLSSLSR